MNPQNKITFRMSSCTGSRQLVPVQDILNWFISKLNQFKNQIEPELQHIYYIIVAHYCSRDWANVEIFNTYSNSVDIQTVLLSYI